MCILCIPYTVRCLYNNNEYDHASWFNREYREYSIKLIFHLQIMQMSILNYK